MHRIHRIGHARFTLQFTSEARHALFRRILARRDAHNALEHSLEMEGAKSKLRTQLVQPRRALVRFGKVGAELPATIPAT